MNTFDEIKKLKELFDAGAISQNEFDSLKKRLIADSGSTQDEYVPYVSHTQQNSFSQKVEEETESNNVDSYSKNNISETSFGAPLWLGWVINIVAWISFLVVWNHPFELMMGLACCLSFYIAYQHKSSFLMYISGFDAVWMFLWGLGLFGDYGMM